MRVVVCLSLFAFGVRAETHSLTLRQALELAARQNPDVTLARLEQQHTEAGVRVAEDPFRPKVILGSGAAYTYGYPNTIEGSAPAIFQVTTQQSLFNKPKSYGLAAARELARGAQYTSQDKIEDVAYQAADLFLTASQVEHQQQILAEQLPSLKKVVDTVGASVAEGADLPIELKRAKVNLASSEEQLSAAQLDADYYEMMLAIVVGYPASDRVKPVDSDLQASVPAAENDAVDTALHNSLQLKEMQSNILAKQMDLRSYKSARMPQIDLVAQYSLFAKYTYEQYFPSNKFQRNNAQIGFAVSLPLLVGAARGGYMTQAYTDLEKLRIQTDEIRNRITSDTRRSYEQYKKAVNIRDLARMKLDLAREDLTVKLAQNAEGRMPLRDLEQARIEESNLWMQLYDSEAQVTRAKLAVLRQMGDLMAAVRSAPEGETQHGDRP